MEERHRVSALGKIAQAAHDTRPAFRAAWPYMLLGVIFGSILLLVHSQWIPKAASETVWARLLEHLGAGFFVSALAVFGYEWRAHMTDTMAIARDLSDRVEDASGIIRTLEDSNRLLATLEAQGSLQRQQAEAGFKRCLEETLRLTDDRLGSWNIRSFIQNCEGLVSLVLELRQRDSWLDPYYVDFLSGILYDGVFKPALALVSLEKEEAENAGDRRLLVNLDSAIVGDRLLAAHMSALNDRDEYKVVSDLDSWRGKRLEGFRAASGLAVSRGVNIIRIFDLVRHRGNFKEEEMEEALRKHIEDARDWKGNGRGGYVVKVLGPVEHSKARAENLGSDKIRAIHFGLFTRSAGDQLRVEVKKPDLSDLALSRSIDLIKDDLANFQILERAAYSISLDDLKSKVREVYALS